MTSKLCRLLAALLRSDRGATAIEYALILSLIALAALGGINALGNSTKGMWENIEANVATAI